MSAPVTAEATEQTTATARSPRRSRLVKAVGVGAVTLGMLGVGAGVASAEPYNNQPQPVQQWQAPQFPQFQQQQQQPQQQPGFWFFNNWVSLPWG